MILKLKQTEIKFHLELIERQAEEIVKLKEELREAKALKQITEGTVGKEIYSERYYSGPAMHVLPPK